MSGRIEIDEQRISSSPDGLTPVRSVRASTSILPARTAWALVAGVGNVLRCDDGFGPAVVHELEMMPNQLQGVDYLDAGLNGLSLVLELFNRYQVLVIIDAVERSSPPGQLYELDVSVPDDHVSANNGSYDPGMDMHELGPGNALLLARALGVLPPVIHMVGCQPAETQILSTEMSPPVQTSVKTAVQAVFAFLERVRSFA